MRWILLLLAGCGSSPSEPTSNVGTSDADAAARAAARLCTLAARVSTPCEVQGTAVELEGKTLSVSSTVQREVAVGTAYNLELGFSVTVDGAETPGLTGRGVGGGPSRGDALDQVADDWARVFGVAIIDSVRHTGRLAALQSLQDGQDPPPAFESGGRVVYPGYTDLRGKRTEARPIDIQDLLGTLGLDGLDDSMHGVYLQFERAGTAIRDPRCMLDGESSEDLCAQMATYPWPEGTYFLKQYLALVPGELPAEVKPRPSGGSDGEVPEAP